MLDKFGIWLSEQVEALSKRNGKGLIGKAAGVFVIYELVCLVALWQLPESAKAQGLYAAVFGVIVFAAIFLLTSRQDPVMANMDDENTWKYVRAMAAMAARSPATIDGNSTPISNPAKTPTPSEISHGGAAK